MTDFSWHDISSVDKALKQQSCVSLVVRRNEGIGVIHAGTMNGIPIYYADWLTGS